jgi:hypothetical protein
MYVCLLIRMGRCASPSLSLTRSRALQLALRLKKNSPARSLRYIADICLLGGSTENALSLYARHSPRVCVCLCVCVCVCLSVYVHACACVCVPVYLPLSVSVCECTVWDRVLTLWVFSRNVDISRPTTVRVAIATGCMRQAHSRASAVASFSMR